MKTLAFILAALVLFSATSYSQTDIIKVSRFDKIIISPHIEANLVEGIEESVEIESSKVELDKINVAVAGKTLRIYLDDAKVITKSEKAHDTHWGNKRPIYEGTIAKVNITYQYLESLSVRGEEEIICNSPINQEEFRLKIYGEAEVTLASLQLDQLNVTIYGQSTLQINHGAVEEQNYVAYGESKVNAETLKNSSTKIKAFGEADFNVNVSTHLKVSAFGEANVHYQGSPVINKGLIIGEAKIKKNEMSL